jgi:hypothetical protein
MSLTSQRKNRSSKLGFEVVFVHPLEIHSETRADPGRFQLGRKLHERKLAVGWYSTLRESSPFVFELDVKGKLHLVFFRP